MARLSDIIEDFIKAMFTDAEENVLEIQRNEMANNFNCSPSQINYVLTTRFTLDKGYYIESKRGGGGCIKITQVPMNKGEYIKNALWENIGDAVTQNNAERYISYIFEQGLITLREATMMRAAINDKTLIVPEEYKDSLRSQILKTILINLL